MVIPFIVSTEIVQCFSFVLGKCIAINKLAERNPIFGSNNSR